MLLGFKLVDLFKLAISLCIILSCVQIGRKVPTLAGLIAVMPLTGVIVLVWLYTNNQGDLTLMAQYCKGAFWGIIPSILFFAVAFLCFRKGFALWIALCIGFTVWLLGAFIHQWLLK